MLTTSRQLFPVASSASTQSFPKTFDFYNAEESTVIFVCRSFEQFEIPKDQDICVRSHSSVGQVTELGRATVDSDSKLTEKSDRSSSLDRSTGDGIMDDMQTTEIPCVRPKYGLKIIGLPEESYGKCHKYKRKPKKKRWKQVDPSKLGFRLSLFPRVPVADENDTQLEEADSFFAVLEEMDELEEKVRPFGSLLRLEGSGKAIDKLVRKDSDQRVIKAHKQIKTKNIISVLNNRGRKTLYIHFRIYKMHPFLHSSAHSHPNLPQAQRKEGVCLEVAKSVMKAHAKLVAPPYSNLDPAPAPAQDLTHALYSGNASADLPVEVLTFFINLQHREMTPEDYEMLLMLDESVAPKTVDDNILSRFRTDVVNDVTAGDVLCSVCMEPYEVGQERKFLPCSHVFHTKCIDMWLKNSSMNCPLDGLPVDSYS